MVLHGTNDLIPLICFSKIYLSDNHHLSSLCAKSGHALQVTLTVLDPKGLKGQSERIEIQSNGGDEFFEITKAALGRTDWYDGLPNTGSNTGLIAVSEFSKFATAVLLAE